MIVKRIDRTSAIALLKSVDQDRFPIDYKYYDNEELSEELTHTGIYAEYVNPEFDRIIVFD